MNEEKPKQPAADFYPRGYKTDSRPQRGWWAPGHYLNRCVKCGDGFIGDKRAGWCADCAYKWEAADDSAKAMRSGPINTKRSDEYAMNPEPTNNDSHEAARPPQGGVDQQRRGRPVEATAERRAAECKCSLRTGLAGDGCAACNPELWEDMMREDDSGPTL